MASAWPAVANSGISGSDVRDMMLEALRWRSRPASGGDAQRQRLAPHRSRHAHLRQPARPEARFTPVKSPQSNGISDAFVNTLKRDYVRVTPLPNAEAVLDLVGGWIEDYNDNHPHSGLKMRSPREFIAALTATA